MRFVKTKIFVVVLVLGIISCIPFETASVPEWKIMVVDRAGIPRAGIEVRQVWNDYSLDFSALDDQSDDKKSGPGGVLIFPERTVRTSLSKRVIAVILDLAKPFI